MTTCVCLSAKKQAESQAGSNQTTKSFIESLDSIQGALLPFTLHNLITNITYGLNDIKFVKRLLAIFEFTFCKVQS